MRSLQHVSLTRIREVWKLTIFVAQRVATFALNLRRFSACSVTVLSRDRDHSKLTTPHFPLSPRVARPIPTQRPHQKMPAPPLSSIKLGLEARTDYESSHHRDFRGGPLDAACLRPAAGANDAPKGVNPNFVLGHETTEWTTDARRSFVPHDVLAVAACAPPRNTGAAATAVSLGYDAFVYDGLETDYKRTMVAPGARALNQALDRGLAKQQQKMARRWVRKCACRST